MLSGAVSMALRDARNLLRSRETLAWTFVMPIVFFYFIGAVTGGGGSEQRDRRDAIGVLIPANAGPLADHLVRRLQDRDFRVVRHDDEAKWATARRRLRVPDRFTESVLNGEPVKLQFERRGEGQGTDFDELRVSRAVYSELADLVAVGTSLGEGDEPAMLAALDGIAAMPRSLTVDVVAAGKRQDIPTGFEQAVPGITVMFLLMIMLTSGGVALTIERESGVLRRLASTPMSRSAVVAGKWGARMLLGIIQLSFAMLTGRLLFGVTWGWPNVLPVIAVLLAYAALAASLGLLLGNFARTQGQAIGIGVLATNALAALGGCWWPIEVTPRWAQQLALFLPTGLTMDAMHKLLSFGMGGAEVLPHIALLLVAAVACGAVASKHFRFQ